MANPVIQGMLGSITKLLENEGYGLTEEMRQEL